MSDIDDVESRAETTGLCGAVAIDIVVRVKGLQPGRSSDPIRPSRSLTTILTRSTSWLGAMCRLTGVIGEQLCSRPCRLTRSSSMSSTATIWPC